MYWRGFGKNCKFISKLHRVQGSAGVALSYDAVDRFHLLFHTKRHHVVCVDESSTDLWVYLSNYDLCLAFDTVHLWDHDWVEKRQVESGNLWNYVVWATGEGTKDFEIFPGNGAKFNDVKCWWVYPVECGLISKDLQQDILVFDVFEEHNRVN